MSDVLIISACRTPIGNFNGALASLSSHDLGSIVIKEALTRAKIPPNDVSEVIMGQALTAGQGQNPARQASLKAGLPITVPAYCVNMLCGSGLKAVASGYQAIKSGDSQIVICGGQESMSQAPHTILLRNGIKMGNGTMHDSLIEDGLTDAMNKVHMGMTAEEIAKVYNISRTEQDQYAYSSQQKVKKALEKKLFNTEIVPVEIKDRKLTRIISEDEFPKPDTTIDGLAKLRAVFKQDGTVTAGNASGINDGAAAVVLCSKEEALRRELTSLAKIVACAQTALEPMHMGLGPVSAVNLVLQKANWSKDDVDLFELNEAFASQSLAVQRELNIPPEKINVNGGALALGHPIGASGARILVTLINTLEQNNGKKGIAALCIGGGMGIALAIEKI